MRTGLLITGGAVALAIAAADVGYRVRLWGATARESRLFLPGDELVAEPADSVTRGVTVRATADSVWRGVEELAEARHGMVMAAERSVLLAGHDGAAVRSLHVLPLAGATAADRCRLVIRRRRRRAGVTARIAWAALSPVDLMLTRRLLLEIKDGAERSAGWTVTA